MECQVLISSGITSTILMIGWFVNNYFTRKHEISKKALDFRLDLLESYRLFSKSLGELILVKNKTEFTNKANEYYHYFDEIQIKSSLFGTKEEINQINEIVELSNKQDYKNLVLKTSDLMQKVKIEIRKELGLKQIV